MTIPLPLQSQSRIQINASSAQKERTAQIISVILSLMMVFPTLLFIVNGIYGGSWQYIILSIFFGSAVLFSGLTATNLFRTIEARVSILTGIIMLALGAFSVIVQGVGLASALISLVLSLIISSMTLTGANGNRLITFGLSGSVIISLLGVSSPFNQITIPLVEVDIPAILGALILVYITMQVMSLYYTTIRNKLLLGALVVVLIPLMVQSFISSQFTQNSITDQSYQSLKFAALQVQTTVDNFLTVTRDTIAKNANLPVVINFLSTPPRDRPGSQTEKEFRDAINVLLQIPHQYLTSYAVLDSTGLNAFDTVPTNVSRFETYNDYFQEPIKTGQAYISNVNFSVSNGDPYIYFSAPVLNRDQKIIGVFRARYDARILQSLINDNKNLLGLHSYPILMDDYQVRLADASNPRFIYHTISSLTSEQIIQLKAIRRLPDIPEKSLSTNLIELSNSLKNYRENPNFITQLQTGLEINTVAGSVIPLNAKPWMVLYTQEQSVLNNLITQQNRISIFIATLIAGLVTLAATYLAQFISNPIMQLTKTADEIGKGNLSVNAEIDSNDEIGVLGTTFMSMSRQLSGLVNELEDRVKARTRDLAVQNESLRYRGRQLETVSDTARSIATVQDLEASLSLVCSLISERFGYYHVGIFLIDEQKEFAYLRAANSEGGKRMLGRQHKLRVGQVGIVGFVTGRGIPRIATDVGEDAVFFNNPDLPLTRSEMALPLRAAGEVIGALDVQSTQAQAFSQDDINLFTTLADQVSVAIVNNRLYEQTAQALEEARQLHRRYLQEEWAKETAIRPVTAYRYAGKNAEPIEIPETSPAIEAAFNTGKASYKTTGSVQSGQSKTSLAIPINLRGEVIGVIHFEELAEKGREWEDEEIAEIQNVADQIASALENARLFEQTTRRAERERKVLDITGKIRSSTDPEEMIQIAVRELQSTLKVSRAQIILQGPLPPQEEPPELSMNPFTTGVDDNDSEPTNHNNGH